MHWPQPLDLLVYVHDQEAFSPDRVLQFLRKFGHVFVAIDYDELHLTELECKVVRHSPFSLVSIVDWLALPMCVEMILRCIWGCERRYKWPQTDVERESAISTHRLRMA